MSHDRKLIALATATLPVVLLGACLISIPIEARAEEPGRAKASPYPNVEDMPPGPDKPAMTAEEQLRLKKELSAARDRQAPKAKSSSTGVAKP